MPLPPIYSASHPPNLHVHYKPGQYAHKWFSAPDALFGTTTTATSTTVPNEQVANQSENPERVEEKCWRARTATNNDGEDTKTVPHTTVMPKEPQTASQQVNETTADAPAPVATNARPVTPADELYPTLDEPLEEPAVVKRAEETHLKPQIDNSKTPLPIRPPPSKVASSGKDQQEATSCSEKDAVGDEVEGEEVDKAVETAGEVGREAAEDGTAGAEHLGIEAADGSSEARSDVPAETDSQGEGGDIKVDHTNTTPRQTCSENDEVENVSETSQTHSGKTHQPNPTSKARSQPPGATDNPNSTATNPIPPEDPVDTTGDDERHPVISTEPPKAAGSAQVDQATSRVKTDESREVGNGLGEDGIETHRSKKPGQTPNTAEEAAIVPCAAKERTRRTPRST